MVNLPRLCVDLKQEASPLRAEINAAISATFALLRDPTPETAAMTAGWKEDFRYIYGDVASNLSSNSKLDPDKLLRSCGAAKREAETSAEAVQLLFFAIQTCYSVLIKYIMRDFLLPDPAVSTPEETILGTFAQRRGITNYSSRDWYVWPISELPNGFDRVISVIESIIGAYRIPAGEVDFDPGSDYLKQIYASLIPKELRRALGEFYTPDWLAEAALRTAAAESAPADITALSILDPTCGSGTFLVKAIAMKRESGSTLPQILSTVRGIDINPLAVLTSKTNYLLSVLDLLDGTAAIPVRQADIIALALSPEAPGMPRSDIIAGNPPWVNWEYMPLPYRQKTRHLWTKYGLLCSKGVDLSFSKEDVSVLITYIVMDLLLKDQGILAFIIRQGVFKSAQNGAGFRRFTLHNGTPVQAIKVIDLSGIRVFEDAASAAALFAARKGRETVYPVPYTLWKRTGGLKSRAFDSRSCLSEVMQQISAEDLYAAPASITDRTSLWLTAPRERIGAIRQVLGTNPYRARTGIFTGGANAVYWLKIHKASGAYVTVTNITDRAKRKTPLVTAELEKELIYPLLRGGGVRKWRTSYDAYILCPHTPETQIRPIPEANLSRLAPKTLAYLQSFRSDLNARKGFAGWEKEIQRQEFHAILRIGSYTFSKYKVIWRYIASQFICAVIGTVNDPYLGEKLLLPNEKIMYVSTDSEEEAYYLCGVLSSTLISECVESYMTPTSISAHILNKLMVPPYDPVNPIHNGIAQICKSGHGKLDITPYIAEIDNYMAKL